MVIFLLVLIAVALLWGAATAELLLLGTVGLIVAGGILVAAEWVWKHPPVAAVLAGILLG